jgi:DNA-binding MarR family transcriptional regulator
LDAANLKRMEMNAGTSIMKPPTTNTSSTGKPVVSLPCACANLRRAARVVTQLYDQEMRRAGLRVTQFTLLQALVRAKNISQGSLADVLGLDSTTLTRTLALLRRKGWIQTKPGEDRRQVRLTLTAEGTREYRRARPYWLSAQTRLRRALGEVHWNRVMEATMRTAALAVER